MSDEKSDGCSLRIGTLIALVFCAVIYILNVSYIKTEQIEWHKTLSAGAIITSILAAGFYGVFMERPLFLKPFLWLLLFYWMVSLFLIVIMRAGDIRLLGSILGIPFENQDVMYHLYIIYFGISIPFGIIWLASFISVGIYFSFFSIVLRFYRKLGGEKLF